MRIGTANSLTAHLSASGDLSGQVNGSSVTLSFEDVTCPPTPVTFDGSLQGEDRITGTFHQPAIPGNPNCLETSGTIDISRQ